MYAQDVCVPVLLSVLDHQKMWFLNMDMDR